LPKIAIKTPTRYSVVCALKSGSGGVTFEYYVIYILRTETVPRVHLSKCSQSAQNSVLTIDVVNVPDGTYEKTLQVLRDNIKLN
jgi:hypothetical protein